MAVSEIQDALLSAFEGTVDTMANRLALDKTVKATVVKCVDAITGEYKVMYNGGEMRAFSDAKTSYSRNTAVYVLVPEGNFSNKKTIVGLVNTQDAKNYTFISSIMDDYNPIGTNVVTQNVVGTFYGLHSYYITDREELYRYGNDGNRLSVDSPSLAAYVRSADGIRIGAQFRTDLPYEHQQSLTGNYGVVVKMAFRNATVSQSEPSYIYRDYVLDTSSSGFIGNPKRLSTFVDEYEVYEIDAENFDHIVSITAFSTGFTSVNDVEAEPDIFVRNIEILPLKKIADMVDGYRLKMSYPSGTVIKNDQTAIDVFGRLINNGTLDLSDSSTWYWFKKDSSVGQTSSKYNSAGGIGWAYLGATNASNHYVMSDLNNTSYENFYKLVVDYNNQVRLRTEFTIYNETRKYTVKITSSKGTEFNFDQGVTDIQASFFDANGTEVKRTSNGNNPNFLEFFWEIVDRNGSTTVLENRKPEIPEQEDQQTAQDKIDKAIRDYTEALAGYEEQLKDLANNETLTKEQIKTQREYIANKIAELKTTLSRQQSETSVVEEAASSTYQFFDEDNSYDRFHYLLSTLDQKAVIKVTAKMNIRGELSVVGYGELELFNKNVVDEAMYHVVIDNAYQMFLYDEAGVPPTHNRMTTEKQEILPLRATLYGPSGDKVENVQVEYLMSSSKSLLKKPADNEDNPLTLTADNRYIIIAQGPADNTECTFELSGELYDGTLEDNQITVVMKVDGKEFRQRTEFLFLKVGDNGNNGTDVVCKIIPEGYTSGIPYIFSDANSWQWRYHTSEGITTASLLEKYLTLKAYIGNKEVNASNLFWSMAGVGKNITAKEMTVSQSDGQISYNKTSTTGNSSIRIVRCRSDIVSGKSGDSTDAVKVCYTFFAIPVVEYTAANRPSGYNIEFDTARCFQYVTYNSEGKRPVYKANAGMCLEAPPFDWRCTWSVLGGKNNNQNTADIELDGPTTTTGSGNKGGYVGDEPFVRIIPKDNYSGLYTNNCVKCVLAKKNDNSYLTVATIYYPICMTLNKYELESLNLWDGNSIKIDEEKGYILAPQIGAGKKNSSNTFTGIVMGERITYDGQNPVSNVGLFGYSEGQQSIFLNAQDGSAHFGLPESDDDSVNGMIEFYPYTGARDQNRASNNKTHIGNWYIGRDALYNIRNMRIINQGTSVKPDYVPEYISETSQASLKPYNQRSAYSQDSDYKKYFVNDASLGIGQNQTGVILNAAPAYLSIKSRFFGVDNLNKLSTDAAFSGGISWNSANTVLSQGDSIEVEIDPHKISTFTIYRHHFYVYEEGKKTDEISNRNIRNLFFGNALLPTYSRTTKITSNNKTYMGEWRRRPLVGINSNGQFYSNAVEDGESTLGIGPVGAFGETAADGPYVGAHFGWKATDLLKFFVDTNETNSSNNEVSDIAKTLYLTTGSNIYSEYPRPMSLHAKSISGYISNGNNTAKTTDNYFILNSNGFKTNFKNSTQSTEVVFGANISEKVSNGYIAFGANNSTNETPNSGDIMLMASDKSRLWLTKDGISYLQGKSNINLNCRDTFGNTLDSGSNLQMTTTTITLSSNSQGAKLTFGNNDKVTLTSAKNGIEIKANGTEGSITNTANVNITNTANKNIENKATTGYMTNTAKTGMTFTASNGDITLNANTETTTNHSVVINATHDIGLYAARTVGIHSTTSQIIINAGKVTDEQKDANGKYAGKNINTRGLGFYFGSTYNEDSTNDDSSRTCAPFLRLNPNGRSGMATYGNIDILSYAGQLTLASNSTRGITIRANLGVSCGDVANANTSEETAGNDAAISLRPGSKGDSTFNITSGRGTVQSTQGPIGGLNGQNHVMIGPAVASHTGVFDGVGSSYDYALYSGKGAHIVGTTTIKNDKDANSANTTTISGGDVSAGGNVSAGNNISAGGTVSASSLSITGPDNTIKSGMNYSWFTAIQDFFDDYFTNGRSYSELQRYARERANEAERNAKADIPDLTGYIREDTVVYAGNTISEEFYAIVQALGSLANRVHILEQK